MNVSIVAFDDFTDIDVFFMWDLLNRVGHPGWSVRLLGDREAHTSSTGIAVPMHGHIREANAPDVVLFASGKGTRAKTRDAEYLKTFEFDPGRQLVVSMCSGALLLAALGLLEGKEATTYPTAESLLEGFGVKVVERPFVCEGNVATAAGCLAAQYLAGWVIERTVGETMRELVLKSIAPVGEGLSHDDAGIEALMKSAASPDRGRRPKVNARRCARRRSFSVNVRRRSHFSGQRLGAARSTEDAEETEGTSREHARAERVFPPWSTLPPRPIVVRWRGARPPSQRAAACAGGLHDCDVGAHNPAAGRKGRGVAGSARSSPPPQSGAGCGS